MEKKQNYTIGTRGSLLAVTQSNITKKQIESQTPLSLEIQTIKTQGDLITDKPLWQLEGKDFFTKELDQNLLEGKIDLVIHSYKDLGSERPEGIELACITERYFPHDILLMRKDIDLSALPELKIGTSSPRRIVNITNHLKDYIPLFEGKIVTENLRGNVNTRIEKLNQGQYHGIVLAFAGLERLAQKPESAAVLKDLIKDLNFMVLPLKEFPPAASQGALAIEVQKNNKVLKKHLEVMNDLPTVECMIRERQAFQSYGGGCHLAVGVHVKQVQDFFVHLHRGEVDNKAIEHKELEGFDYSSLRGKSVYYMFKDFDYLIDKVSLDLCPTQDQLYITSQYCIDQINGYETLWAAGNRTMKKLAERGYWVCGSSEGFGHEEISKFKTSQLLKLFLESESWQFLSHDHAQSSVGELVPCYTHKIKTEFDEAQEDLLLEADIIYWSSVIQYKTYTQKYPMLEGRQHACGLGKTYMELKSLGINPIPCIDMGHLKKVINEL